jgi:hypothetical protein
MSEPTDPLDLELASLGSPLEAVPDATATEILAKANVVVVPVIAGLAGWTLMSAIGGSMAAGLALGLLWPMAWAPGEAGGGPGEARIVHQVVVQTDGIGAQVSASDSAPRVVVHTLKRTEAVGPRMSRPAPMPLEAQRSQRPDSAVVTLALPNDNPPSLEALIGAMSIDAENEVTVARAASDRSRDAEWRAHLGLGPRAGIGALSGSRGIGIGGGVDLYLKSRSLFGVVLGLRSDLAMVGRHQPTELATAKAEAGAALRGDKTALQLSWSGGAHWHKVPDPLEATSGSPGSGYGAQGALRPELTLGLRPITGPAATLVLGDRQRGALRVSGGVDLMPSPVGMPTRTWLSIGLDVPLAIRRPDSRDSRVVEG